MTAGLFDDITSKANAMFGEFTSFAGGILGHGHHTATSSFSSQKLTATLSISRSSESTKYTHHADSISSTGSIWTLTSSPTSQLSKITTTIASSSTPVTPTAVSTSNARAANANAYQIYFICLLFAAAIIFMFILLCSAPIIIRSCKFAINFLKIALDRSGGTFGRDSESGLTSDAFTLQDNIEREDRRHGLDKKAKLRILWFMFWYEEPFDEARLRYVKYQFALNGIGEDGQPLDPKYIRTEY